MRVSNYTVDYGRTRFPEGWLAKEELLDGVAGPFNLLCDGRWKEETADHYRFECKNRNVSAQLDK